MSDFDETYVLEILAAAHKRPPMTREQFKVFCAVDARAGYHVEVDEAERRYFEGRPCRKP